MEIKTLAEIMAQLDNKQASSASPNAKKRKKTSANDRPDIAKTRVSATNHTAPINTTTHTSHSADDKQYPQPKPPKRSKKSNPFHPAAPSVPQSTTQSMLKTKQKPNHPTNTQSPTPNNIKAILQTINKEQTCNTENKNNKPANIDNLTDKLKSTLKTDEERQAELEELKANSRLRWLAFYYLSRREHSAAELKDKLIAKAQDPAKIDALLEEFKDKGYQSDYRTAMMLIREGIRKRRGRVRIKQSFYERKVSLPSNIDELIDMAMEDSDAFADVVSDDPLIEGVDWLKLAVEARVKKYGDQIPSTPKDKARQLRFLQYRGFKPDICFEALKYTPNCLKDRF